LRSCTAPNDQVSPADVRAPAGFLLGGFLGHALSEVCSLSFQIRSCSALRLPCAIASIKVTAIFCCSIGRGGFKSIRGNGGTCPIGSQSRGIMCLARFGGPPGGEIPAARLPEAPIPQTLGAESRSAASRRNSRPLSICSRRPAPFGLATTLAAAKCTHAAPPQVTSNLPIAAPNGDRSGCGSG